MKKHLFLLSLMAAYISGQAQSANGSTTLSMSTGNTVAISFTGNNSNTGSLLSLPFTSASDYANGVASSDQQIEVISNKNFNIAVKASSANFAYTGNAMPVPAMPVAGTLKLMVPANTTGGAIAAPFSASAFQDITAANQNLITNGTTGTSQLFSVKYKAMPGFAYPSGTYTVDIIYTATQL